MLRGDSVDSWFLLQCLSAERRNEDPRPSLAGAYGVCAYKLKIITTSRAGRVMVIVVVIVKISAGIRKLYQLPRHTWNNLGNGWNYEIDLDDWEAYG